MVNNYEIESPKGIAQSLKWLENLYKKVKMEPIVGQSIHSGLRRLPDIQQIPTEKPPLREGNQQLFMSSTTCEEGASAIRYGIPFAIHSVDLKGMLKLPRDLEVTWHL
jgi:hypothetical protein